MFISNYTNHQNTISIQDIYLSNYEIYPLLKKLWNLPSFNDYKTLVDRTFSIYIVCTKRNSIHILAAHIYLYVHAFMYDIYKILNNTKL